MDSQTNCTCKYINKTKVGKALKYEKEGQEGTNKVDYK